MLESVEERTEVFLRICKILDNTVVMISDNTLKDIGKLKSVLRRELNPNDSKAKLGLETFMHLLTCMNNDDLKTIRDELLKLFPEFTPDVKVKHKSVVPTKVEITTTSSKDIENDPWYEYYSDMPDRIGRAYTYPF